jgi:hypothetical protein
MHVACSITHVKKSGEVLLNFYGTNVMHYRGNVRRPKTDEYMFIADEHKRGT